MYLGARGSQAESSDSSSSPHSREYLSQEKGSEKNSALYFLMNNPSLLIAHKMVGLPPDCTRMFDCGRNNCRCSYLVDKARSGAAQKIEHSITQGIADQLNNVTPIICLEGLKYYVLHTNQRLKEFASDNTNSSVVLSHQLVSPFSSIPHYRIQNKSHFRLKLCGYSLLPVVSDDGAAHSDCSVPGACC